MDLAFAAQEQAFRAECASWFGQNLPGPLASMDTPEGFEQHRAWEKRLHDAGWSAVNWPRAFGGREATLIEWLIFEEEYYRAGAPRRLNQNGLFLLAPTLLEFGTEEQKQRFLPPIASCDEIWCQGWSEPNAGSDLASLTSRATRDGSDRASLGRTRRKRRNARGVRLARRALGRGDARRHAMGGGHRRHERRPNVDRHP